MAYMIFGKYWSAVGTRFDSQRQRLPRTRIDDAADEFVRLVLSIRSNGVSSLTWISMGGELSKVLVLKA